MKELVRQGYLIQVGQKYVDTQELPDWELWQISRLMETLSQESIKAHKLSKLRKEKKEMAKEQLEELAEQSSNRWAKRQVEEIQALEDSARYYEQKKELMDKQEKAVLKLYIAKKQQAQENSEKSESPDFRNSIESMAIPA